MYTRYTLNDDNETLTTMEFDIWITVFCNFFIFVRDVKAIICVNVVREENIVVKGEI